MDDAEGNHADPAITLLLATNHDEEATLIMMKTFRRCGIDYVMKTFWFQGSERKV